MRNEPRLERAYAALCACHSAIVRAISEEQLADALCRILVELGGYRMAWIGYAEPDEARSVSVRAAAGAGAGYLKEIRISWGDDEHGRGPTGRAILTGAPQLNRDTRTDSDYGPWREQALRHGFASSVALPLRHEGVTFGALTVYAAEPEAFDEQERTLLVRFAEDLSFGIGALRARQALGLRDQQLRQAAKMEVIGRLTSGMIHDFNNLLAVIQSGATDLTETLPAGTPAHATASDVTDASTRAIELARRILALARGTPPSLQVQPLGPILRGLQPLLVRVLGRSVTSALEIDPAAGAARIDVGHVEQLVLNLAINARDAMPDGGRLAVSVHDARRVPEEARPAGRDLGGAVELRVSDTGTGIPPAVAAHLFEPFFTTKPEGKGTGLGLAVVHGIVEHYGGRIAVETSPGAGTTFRLFLPTER